jgi:hypothetical protein
MNLSKKKTRTTAAFLQKQGTPMNFSKNWFKYLPEPTVEQVFTCDK